MKLLCSIIHIKSIPCVLCILTRCLYTSFNYKRTVSFLGRFLRYLSSMKYVPQLQWQGLVDHMTRRRIREFVHGSKITARIWRNPTGSSGKVRSERWVAFAFECVAMWMFVIVSSGTLSYSWLVLRGVVSSTTYCYVSATVSSAFVLKYYRDVLFAAVLK